jgi:predicted acyl esterase
MEQVYKFFAHFLKGEDSGWFNQPKVSLNIRRPGEQFEIRAENEWPLARTQWTPYYLDPQSLDMAPNALAKDATITYENTG